MDTKMKYRLCGWASAMVFVLATGAEARANGSGAGGAEAPAPTPEVTQLTAEQLLAVLDAANRAEITESTLAIRRGRAVFLRDYARRINRDHRNLVTVIRQFIEEADIQPMENDASRALQTSAREMRDSLEAASAEEFDRVYVEHKLNAHRMLLRFIDASEPCQTQGQAAACIRFASSLAGQAGDVDVDVGTLSPAQILLAVARARVVSHLVEAEWLMNQIEMAQP